MPIDNICKLPLYSGGEVAYNLSKDKTPTAIEDSFMGTLWNKIKSRSIQEMIREYSWLGRYTLQHKRAVLWYVCVGILGTALRKALEKSRIFTRF